jgi:hypothetical protein
MAGMLVGMGVRIKTHIIKAQMIIWIMKPDMMLEKNNNEQECK